MTIIHLLVGLGGGGAESFLLELSKNIKKSKKANILVVGLTSINTIGYKYKAEGIEYLSLDITGARGFWPKFRYFLQILKRYESCVIHAHMFHAAIVACMAKICRPKLQIVFTLHTNFVKQYYRRALLFLTKPLRAADIIFSPDSRQWYHKENALTIANGIDLSRFTIPDNRPDEFTFLFLGRLSEPKNPLYLVKLVERLKSKYTFKILVSGTGNLRGDLEKQIKNHQIQNYIELIGFQNDIPKLFSGVHCLIMPSLWEGMPMAILEAGAAGVPIVSTPVGSIPSILNHTNAHIGTIEQFPEMVEDVLLNYDAALQKAEILKQKIYADYDINSITQKHLEVYAGIHPTREIRLIPISEE